MPVLGAMAKRKLKAVMPVEVGAGGKLADRGRFTHLEALGRLVAGLGPWLELPDDGSQESQVRRELRELTLGAIDAGTDPASADFLNFNVDSQPLVDAALLCQGLLRAPTRLFAALPAKTRGNLLVALKQTRGIHPPPNNWMLFPAMVEALLFKAGDRWLTKPVEDAFFWFEEWFKGDGAYGDGALFHWDYYNSFTIHPMLLDLLDVFEQQRAEWAWMKWAFVERARRFAAVLERMVSPEGTLPVIGRSLAYRMGTLHLLGQMALRHELPEGVSPAQVRCAMTAVMQRTMNAPGTFDEQGWLRIGLAGHQPFLGETYVSTGSLYFAALGLLPLGLEENDPFWQSPAEDWTSRRVWSGGAAPIDHAADGRIWATGRIGRILRQSTRTLKKLQYRLRK